MTDGASKKPIMGYISPYLKQPLRSLIEVVKERAPQETGRETPELEQSQDPDATAAGRRRP